MGDRNCSKMALKNKNIVYNRLILIAGYILSISSTYQCAYVMFCHFFQDSEEVMAESTAQI